MPSRKSRATNSSNSSQSTDDEEKLEQSELRLTGSGVLPGTSALQCDTVRIDWTKFACELEQVTHSAELSKSSAERIAVDSLVTVGSVKDPVKAQKKKEWIKAMHEYNEAKDCALTLLGLWAQRKGATVKALYAHYGLEADD